MSNWKKTAALLFVIALCLSMTVLSVTATGDTGFSDVAAGTWYTDGVAYCRENGLMSGVGTDTFDPNGSMTRAMLVTVLHRAAGTPAAGSEARFQDVATGSWYADAVAWATQQGIVSGYGNGLFGTNDPVTREQLAAILWRQAGSPTVETAARFADEASISGYAVDAVNWARSNGIINGLDGNRFSPGEIATRAQVAVILMNRMKPENPPASKETGNSDSFSGGAASGGQTPTPPVTPTPAPDPTPTPTPAPTPTPDPVPVGKQRVLVAYFSATNNTEGVAQKIVNVLGADTADLFEIVPDVPYTAEDLKYYTDCRADREQSDPNARPAIADTCKVENMEDYDVVLLGYPIWHGQAPRIISTFLESYDFSGKTIVPFCTSASSGYSDSAIRPLAPSAAWQTGRRFAGNASQDTVESWVNGLNLELTK